jgi:hypothetical protein
MSFSTRPSVNRLQVLKSLVLKYAEEVAAAYGQLLEKNSSPFYRPESQLPFSKTRIRESIELLLTEPLEPRRRNFLECVDLYLNKFIPDEEFNKIGKADAALTEAFQLFQEGEEMDAPRLAKALAAANIPETASRRNQLDDRVDRELDVTMNRHRFLREAAAELGDVHSLFQLVLMCDLAEKLGADFRDTLAKNVAPEQLAEVQKLAQEWKTKGK